ncbi:MAG: RNA polymerase subunit sigma-70 [Caldilineaceae bacterium]
MSLQTIPHEEFGQLVEPYRRELRVHCYRMLGSLLDAEDLVQETLLRAWRRRETFAQRGTLRAWLYKIATNLCLDALQARSRRTIPVVRQPAATLDAPIPPAVSEPIWLEPFPDTLLAPDSTNPEAHVLRKESVTLAFIHLLQHLPPRQRAVLILRDVLEWPASDVADLLDLSVPAVKSALYRARTTLAAQPVVSTATTVPPAPDEQTHALLARYVQAWEKADPHELATLLQSDATFSMPPIPAWYQGRATIQALVTKTIFAGDAVGRWRLLPTRANGQVAFGLYRRGDDGQYGAYGIQLLTLAGQALTDILTVRNPALLPFFDLPATLP